MSQEVSARRSEKYAHKEMLEEKGDFGGCY